MHFRKQKKWTETPDGFNWTPGSVALIHRQPARAALPMEASVPPRKAPLLALAATLTLEGDTSCPVCRESSAAVRAVVVAGFLEGGRAWSARDPAMVGSVRRAPVGWAGQGGRRWGRPLIRPFPFSLSQMTGSEASGPDPQLAVTMGFTGFGEWLP